MGHIHRLGLRRAFLTEPDGKNNNGSHCEKFTLPVLKGFKPKPGISNIMNGCGKRFIFCHLLFIKIFQASVKMKHKRKDKQNPERY